VKKTLLVVAVLLTVVVVVALLRRPKPTPAPLPTGVESVIPADSPATPPSIPPESSAPPVAPRPLPVATPSRPATTTQQIAAVKVEAPVVVSAQSAVETVRVAVRLYGSMFGGNPVGNNAEITAALLGANPKKAQLLENYRLNERGELIDEWGMPYFFHQLSGSETEVRSAGSDRQMWTSDDIVMR
jgi:hypothetical protein